jgi:PIN domain nuclease of toxin-antitoxin system
MRSVLLDTHILLWAILEPHRLPASLREDFGRSDVRWFVSQVSWWEIQVKHDLGKLPLSESPRELRERILSDGGFAPAPLQDEAIFLLGRLPPIHRDPFDRILVSTAIVNGWSLATVDPLVRAYPVPIWPAA